MIWLSWRQFRAQAITGAAALALFAILLAVTEAHMGSLYDTSGIIGCHGDACVQRATTFLTRLSSGQTFPVLPGGTNAYVILYFLSVLVILVAPVILGIFWGAPLVAREFEAGTNRLVWNQGVTRTRWLTVKLILVGLAAMVVTEAFSLLQAWWAAPIGKAVGLGGGASILSENRFGWFVFPTHGITPLGYAAFGFVLGVTAGLLIRRTVPAMAVTVAVFAVVQFITPLWIRPNLFPTDRTVSTIAATGASANPTGYVTLVVKPRSGSGPSVTTSYVKFVVDATTVPGHPGAWITSSAAVNAAGQPASAVPKACYSAIQQLQNPSGSPALDNCLTSHGTLVAVSYQPASHYWPLQFAETGLYLVLALALAWYCFWRLNRRLS